jgi:hypothetical protein
MVTTALGNQPGRRCIGTLPGGRLDWNLGVAHMEKVVLLCVLIAIIGILAELSPAPEPQRKT